MRPLLILAILSLSTSLSARKTALGTRFVTTADENAGYNYEEIYETSDTELLPEDQMIFGPQVEAWDSRDDIEGFLKSWEAQNEAKACARKSPTSEAWKFHQKSKEVKDATFAAVEIEQMLREDARSRYEAKECDPNPQKTRQEAAKNKKTLKPPQPVLPRCDRRLRGNCLRGVKLALCGAKELSPGHILKGGNAWKMCDKDGKSKYTPYGPTGSAKDYPKELANKGWVNHYCNLGKILTPEEAPVGAVICYEASDPSLAGDSAAKHGHCEIKVSECMYCSDGCTKKPRTGSAQAAEGRNRKINSIMLKMGEGKQKQICDESGVQPKSIATSPAPPKSKAKSPVINQEKNDAYRPPPSQAPPAQQ